MARGPRMALRGKPDNAREREREMKNGDYEG